MKRYCKRRIGMSAVKRLLAIVLSASVLMQQIEVYATEVSGEDGTVSEGDVTVSKGDVTVSGGDMSVSSGDVSSNIQEFVPYEFYCGDYNITFSAESGTCGSVVEAVLKYSGTESREELQVVWRADESKLDPLEQATTAEAVLSAQSYEVIANEASVQKVYADLYHGEYCIGTVASGDFVLKTDNNAPSIGNIYYSAGSQSLLELADLKNIYGTGNLILQTSVEDLLGEQENEAVSGINKVWVNIDKQNYAMTFNSTLNVWEVEIEMPENRHTRVKPSIYVLDKAGNEISKELPRFSIDKEQPSLELSLKNGDETVTGWYSEAVAGNALKIQIETGDQSRIQKIEIAKDAKFENIVETILCTSEDTNTPFVAQTGEGVISGDQNQNYYVRVFDEWGNASGASIQVTIDNAEPENAVGVKFCGTEDMLVQLGDETETCEYIISQKQGCVFDKDEISLVLTMQDAVHNDVASGIAAVDFVLQVKDGVTGEIKQTPVHIDAEKIYTMEDGKVSIYYCMEIPDGEVFEKSFQICDLYITDKAGNVCPGNVEGNVGGMQDQVLYYVDNSAPRVDYAYGTAEIVAGTVEAIEDGNIQYFSTPFTAQVIVTDANLSEVEVTNALVEGNQQADIVRLAEDGEKALSIMEDCQYTLGVDGKYQLCVKADDILHNGSVEGEMLPVLSDIIIVDTIAPQIAVSVCNSAGENVSSYANQYFAQDMLVKMQIEELYLKHEAVQVSISGVSASGKAFSITLEPDSWSENGSVYTNQYQITEEGYYTIAVSCTDKAGNRSELETEGFYIDKTAPVVSINYDNNDPMNGFYYNATRTATVTVTDYSFDAANVQHIIKAIYGSEPTVGEWSHQQGEGCDGSRHTENCAYTAQVSFGKDDIYDFTFACTDKAGLQSEAINAEHFVVDKTAPIILITFDNNAAANGYFYNTARTAYIQVTDISFAENLVGVAKTGEQTVDSLPVLSAFDGGDKVYTASLTFDKDGVYQFSADATDLAGNKAEIRYCPLFIVDMTAPEISFGGVGEFSANSGIVMPTVEYRDRYLNDAESALDLSGYYHGSITKNFTKEAVAEGYTVAFEDFAYEKEADDLYTLSVGIKDYAGNETTKTLVFSVNRFGSVYVLDEESQAILENYYLAQAPELVVSEINVDNLEKQQITCSLDGITTTLMEGIHYIVEKQGTETTWKSYDYILMTDNFETEGYYVITIASTDAAQNNSDNRNSGTEIVFAVDKTAPSVVVSGIEENEIYHTEQLVVRADIKDNMSLGYVAIYDGEKLLHEYYEDALAENLGEITFTIVEAKETRDIRIVARDMAGNELEMLYENVTVSTAVSLLTDTIAPLSSTIMDETGEKRPMQILWIVMLGVLVIFAGTCMLWVVKRRKERQ